jgi:hypothetical protein
LVRYQWHPESLFASFRPATIRRQSLGFAQVIRRRPRAIAEMAREGLLVLRSCCLIGAFAQIAGFEFSKPDEQVVRQGLLDTS